MGLRATGPETLEVYFAQLLLGQLEPKTAAFLPAIKTEATTAENDPKA